MKTINKIRSTNQFCITAGHINHMARIQEWCESSGRFLVAVAYENEPHDNFEYTIRVTESSGLVDYRVAVNMDVKVMDRKLIIERQGGAQ